MGSTYPLTGCRVLIVEDEPLISLWLATLCRSFGTEVVSVRSHAEAREVIERRSIGAAVLDYLVGDDDVTQLCGLLTGGGIPFMIYSGYEGLRSAFPNNVVVQKPAAAADVIAAITSL